ncbi:flavin reductase family protein [Rhodobacteraceae bacterium XHP0102]|nr:flavin reductase family protein [Rhodobacteraceae bacterium XHP0102]
MNQKLRHHPLSSFVPDPANPRAFRTALGCFATGVTIVTVQSDEGPVAITANSFSSVSLDPALVLWSIDRASRRYRFFADAPAYAIHVLGADQEDLCWRIARDAKGLRSDDFDMNAEGVPVLHDCLARFECTAWAAYAGGDHDILVGQVLRAGHRETGGSLGFFRGKLGQFAVKETEPA